MMKAIAATEAIVIQNVLMEKNGPLVVHFGK